MFIRYVFTNIFPLHEFPFCSVVCILWCAENFDESLLFSFSFWLCFWIIPLKFLPNPMSWSFSFLFFSKSFIAWILIFRSFICFELILCITEGRGPTSFFFVWISGVPALFAEKTVLSPLDGLGTLVKNRLTTHRRVYFCALYSISLVNTSTLMTEESFICDTSSKYLFQFVACPFLKN